MANLDKQANRHVGGKTCKLHTDLWFMLQLKFCIISHWLVSNSKQKGVTFRVEVIQYYSG